MNNDKAAGLRNRSFSEREGGSGDGGDQREEEEGLGPTAEGVF
jgi:hypothetical protein